MKMTMMTDTNFHSKHHHLTEEVLFIYTELSAKLERFLL